MSQSITDPVMQVVQRFGLALLYQKSRVVLHRRYLTEVAPSKEQSYSRRTCLEAALALVDYQCSIFEAARPGAMLHQNGWFVSSLAINDYLLADVIVALAIQSPHYAEAGGNFDWISHGTPVPPKTVLLDQLRLSLDIWKDMAVKVSDCKRAVRVVETILKKTEAMRGAPDHAVSLTSTLAGSSDATTGSMEGLPIDGVATNTASSSIGSAYINDAALYPGYPTDRPDYDVAQVGLSWIQQMDVPGGNYDWVSNTPMVLVIESIDMICFFAEPAGNPDEPRHRRRSGHGQHIIWSIMARSKSTGRSGLLGLDFVKARMVLPKRDHPIKSGYSADRRACLREIPESRPLESVLVTHR